MWEDKLLTESLANNYKFWLKYKNTHKLFEDSGAWTKVGKLPKGSKYLEEQLAHVDFQVFAVYHEGSWGNQRKKPLESEGNISERKVSEKGSSKVCV